MKMLGGSSGMHVVYSGFISLYHIEICMESFYSQRKFEIFVGLRTRLASPK